MRRPAVAIVVAGGALVALAIPAFGMNVKTTGLEDFPQELSTIQTYNEDPAALPVGASAGGPGRAGRTTSAHRP